MSRRSTALFLLAFILATGAVYALSLQYFRAEELARAQARLSFFRSTVSAELNRFSHLSYILARDPLVIRVATQGAPDPLDARLREFAQAAELDAIYLMDPEGVTRASSNAGLPSSFVGQTYAFRPYFQQAMQGRQGRFYAIGATTGEPGYFIADPVLDETGQVLGVIALKLGLGKLEQAWRGSGEEVALANQDGVVLLSSVDDWRYRALRPLTPEQRDIIAQARQFPGQDLVPLPLETRRPGLVRVDGASRLHVVAQDLPSDWRLHYFSADDRAQSRSLGVTGVLVFLAALGFILFQSQRNRRIGAALRRSEEEEAALRQANERLAVEIDERRTAERRLRRTQDDLERASRLAALGQLAASVTHELGQPIAAMRNHLVAAEMATTPPTGLPAKVSALVDRMEGITQQLKFFARREDEGIEDVDLVHAMQTACSLVAPNVQDAGARVHQDYDAPRVLVRGNRLRLEQVMTNLLRNAVDAVEEAETRNIWLRIGGKDGQGWFEVADSGHGLGDADLAVLQEPFVTTRESGRGMGLGLSISAGIVRDHGGIMTARNRASGGAVFRVDLPGQEDEETA